MEQSDKCQFSHICFFPQEEGAPQFVFNTCPPGPRDLHYYGDHILDLVSTSVSWSHCPCKHFRTREGIANGQTIHTNKQNKLVLYGKIFLMDQSQGKNTCPGQMRDGSVKSFSQLLSKCLFSTYCIWNFVLGLVRAEGLMMAS